MEILGLAKTKPIFSKIEKKKMDDNDFDVPENIIIRKEEGSNLIPK